MHPRKFLGNTWAGFAEELLITFISTIGSMALYNYTGAASGHSYIDNIVVFILLLVLFESVVRIIRWTIVYHAPIYLYFLHFPAFIAVFIGAATIGNVKSLDGFVIGFALILISFIYFVIMYLKREVIRKKSPPGLRIQQLKWKMSMWERITLVFPDMYIKFLETGDEKYLRGKE